MIIVGIDPGADGAVAVLPIYSIGDTVALKVQDNLYSDILLYLSEIRGGDPDTRMRSNHVKNREECYIGLKRVRPNYDSLEEINSLLGNDEKNLDQTMEVFLEEPGQIVVPFHKGDKTKALLAGMSSSRKLGRSHMPSHSPSDLPSFQD